MTKSKPDYEATYRAVADNIVRENMQELVEQIEEQAWHQSSNFDIDPYYIMEALARKWKIVK